MNATRCIGGQNKIGFLKDKGTNIPTTNYNKILTKKAIFMQKLIHIHQYKVDYC